MWVSWQLHIPWRPRDPVALTVSVGWGACGIGRRESGEEGGIRCLGCEDGWINPQQHTLFW